MESTESTVSTHMATEDVAVEEEESAIIHTVQVRVVRLGDSPQDYVLSASATAQQAMEAAGFSPSDGDVYINARRAELDDQVVNGDVILIAPPVRGG